MNENQNEPLMTEGTRVTLDYPDGTVKYGYIKEVDNGTRYILCDDGTTQIIGG